MAGRINDDDVKAVRDAVPIDAVVSEYLQLRNAGGGNLKGLCPFHDEKSPSFQVSPSKGLFHCFGCQEGGDTIAFVQKIDHLTFAEVVERLAAKAGITLRYEEGGYNPSHQRGERIRLVEAHKVAAQFYVEQLDGPEAEIGRKFLAERGFDQAAAEHFGVGYSPAGWDHLTRYLRGKGFSDKELITSGLSQDGRRGPIDRFRGRLMWPISDTSGDIVGFGARKLRDDDNGPKYLNTPETPIYKKSQVLYGIDLAKKDIAKSSRAVVVEGYTDVMACHLAGVTTAIATCGTAFGGDHIKILRRLLMDNGSARVIFTFDGDAAGQKAALRAFEDDQKFAAETYIAIAPDNMDPCDLRLAKGDEAVRDLVEPRTPLFEFALRQIVARYDLETPAGRAAALDEAAQVVAKIKTGSVQREVAVQLAGFVGILDQEYVVHRVNQLAQWARGRGDRGPAPATRGGSRRQEVQAPAVPSGPALNLRSPAHRTERELLKLALQARPGLPGVRRLRGRRVHRPAVRRGPPVHRGGGRRGARRPRDPRVPRPGARRDPQRHGAQTGHGAGGRGLPRQVHRRGVRGRAPGQGPPARRRPPDQRRPGQSHPPRQQRRPGPPGRRTERGLGPPAVRPVPAQQRRRRALTAPRRPPRR